MNPKAVMPRDKNVNLKFNEKTKRWDYTVRLVRPDAKVFRRAGSASTEQAAREKRNAAYREFNNDLGKAKEDRKLKKHESSDSLRAWTERVLPVIKDDCAPT